MASKNTVGRRSVGVDRVQTGHLKGAVRDQVPLGPEFA